MRLSLPPAVLLLVAPLLFAAPALAAAAFPVDRIAAAGGEIAVTFIGHASLIIQYAGKVVHVDPCGQFADYALLPKADLILITHDHPDHLDPAAIAAVSREGTEPGTVPRTVIVANGIAGAKLPEAKVLKNGEGGIFAGVPVRATPAYNRVNRRPDGKPFHPRGEGNGYVLTFGDRRVYVAGDTEDIPEMKELAKEAGGIDVAFLPVNLPYTMTPEMLFAAAHLVRPRILYPYHTGDTDMAKVAELLKDMPGVEVRIRPMK
jgi:L-ascorbate metabolism protein UlaG (beta-lactamase superfamily)